MPKTFLDWLNGDSGLSDEERKALEGNQLLYALAKRAYVAGGQAVLAEAARETRKLNDEVEVQDGH